MLEEDVLTHGLEEDEAEAEAEAEACSSRHMLVTVETKRCDACGSCESCCPTRALYIERQSHGGVERKALVFVASLCVECGACACACDKGLIDLSGTTDEDDPLFSVARYMELPASGLPREERLGSVARRALEQRSSTTMMFC